MANEQNTQKGNKDATTGMTGIEGAGKTDIPVKPATTVTNLGTLGKDSVTGGGQTAKDTASKSGENKNNESASQLASQVGEVMRGNTGAAKDIISQAKETTGNLAGQALGQVQEKAGTQIDKGKANLAQGLGSVADSIRQMGENLKGSGQESGVVALTAQYGDSLARQVEQFSDYLEKHNVGDMMRDVERFARRNPAVFIGGAFALGLLGARFLKTSNTHQQLMEVERHNNDELNRIRNSNRSTTGGGTSLSGNKTGSSDTKTTGSGGSVRPM